MLKAPQDNFISDDKNNNTIDESNSYLIIVGHGAMGRLIHPELSLYCKNNRLDSLWCLPYLGSGWPCQWTCQRRLWSAQWRGAWRCWAGPRWAGTPLHRSHTGPTRPRCYRSWSAAWTGNNRSQVKSSQFECVALNHSLKGLYRPDYYGPCDYDNPLAL